MDIFQLKQKFIELYGENGQEIRSFFAPGRVNLIGEHTDYNGGYVFPCALDFGTYAIARKRDDEIIQLASLNFELRGKAFIYELIYNENDDWMNYPKGVVQVFKGEGYNIGGFDVIFYGNIPNGAGLSSSASLELVTSVLLKHLFELDVDMIKMVELSQKAENEFVGVNCGIMDQFAVGMGKEKHAIFLDCKSLDYKYVPIKLKGYKLVIANTNKRRCLADSKYNERRSECEKAINNLRENLDIHLLGEIDKTTFEINKYLIKDENLLKRATHVIYENHRVITAIEKLKEGDLESFGTLMKESHQSLKELYEVSGIELDTLVGEANKIEGVVGSRMTGAGFGGCTVSIVQEQAVETFIQRVGENYKKRTGLEADFYIAQVGAGARELPR